MSITIELSPLAEKLLRERAHLQGLAPEVVLSQLTEDALSRDAVRQPLDGLSKSLQPVREAFAEAGYQSEEDFDALFGPLIEEVRAERSRRQPD